MCDDEDALQELFRASPRDAVHSIRHYLYFADERTATHIAAELRSYGYATDERRSADDLNWLVLASHSIVPTPETIAVIREALEALATQYGGEYDGWEAEVPSEPSQH